MNKEYNDKLFINPDTVAMYANTNEAFLNVNLKGIIVEFPGLGGGSCLGGSMEPSAYEAEHAKAYAGKGILMVYIFPGPWSWGNAAAVRIADAVIDALIEKYALAADVPVVASGGSMGGLGALNYAAYSRHNLCGVAAACPCVDVIASLSCKADLPRTYISAVAGYDMPLEDALKRISPIELVAQMPDIPYFICSDGEDEFFPEPQLEGYMHELRSRGLNVIYRRQPGQPHGYFLSEIWDELHMFMEACILQGCKTVKIPDL